MPCVRALGLFACRRRKPTELAAGVSSDAGASASSNAIWSGLETDAVVSNDGAQGLGWPARRLVVVSGAGLAAGARLQ